MNPALAYLILHGFGLYIFHCNGNYRIKRGLEYKEEQLVFDVGPGRWSRGTSSQLVNYTLANWETLPYPLPTMGVIEAFINAT